MAGVSKVNHKEIADKISKYKETNDVSYPEACKALGFAKWQWGYSSKQIKAHKKGKGKIAKRAYTRKSPTMQTVVLPAEQSSGNKLMVLIGAPDDIMSAIKGMWS